MSATPGPTIIAHDLTKVFGRLTAVDHLSFEIGAGEIFGFLGPNGAGKSTTIRMLCGLLSSTGGTASVGGFDINREPIELRAHIGYMSQKFSLYRDLSVAENVAFFGGVYGLSGARLRERAATVIEMAGLKGLEEQITGSLSGALLQRLALGCAVIHEPPILFLDEPTSGVDPISRRIFWDLVQDLGSRGVTILVTTHFMDEAEFCQRIGLINEGRFIALDAPSAIRKTAVNEDLFEVELAALKDARPKIEALDGVASTSYFGQRIHVFCARGRCGAEDLEGRIASLGFEAPAVRAVPMTLEDAFVRLVQRSAKEAVA
jgi:ABC-2 type transport system ATP-binding protein